MRRMSLGSVADSIDVNEPLPPSDMASSQTATQINADAFEALARGRSFHTVLMMAPGVRQEAKAGSTGVGGISVDGASGSENSYFIDGVDVTDIMTGALRPQNSIPFEFIRELQVKSGGFEAEFGGATGGVVTSLPAAARMISMVNFKSKRPLQTGMPAIAATTSDPLRIRYRPSSFGPVRMTTVSSTREYPLADPF